MNPDKLAALVAEHNFRGALEQLAAADLSNLTDTERGHALAIEAVCKDRLAQQEGFLSSFLAQVFEQIKPGWVFRTALAGQLIELDEDGAAEGILRNLVSQLPADARLRCDLAGTVERQGRIEEAEALYAEAADRASQLAGAWLGRGRCLQALGRVDEACDALRQYLALSPEDLNIWLSLAVLEAGRGRSEAAEEAFTRAEQLDPGSPGLLFHRVAFAVQQGSDRAGEYAECLAQVAPADWRSEAATALIAEAQGELEIAQSAVLRAFDRALAEPDPELQEAGLVQVFLFLQRHRLRTQAEKLEAGLHSHGLLPEGVLAVLRSIRGEWSDEAEDYFVLVGGEAPLHAAEVSGDARKTGEQWCSFLRAYRVYAVSAESAETEALRSESRSGGRNHRVEEAALSGPADGQFLGVRFRSGRMFYNPPSPQPE